ncbi:MAG: S-layer homology domain-containing protein [Clostridia bacterium]|nr:S-layer homology domain-containing protein [Clostridia bacterium]
MKKIALFLALVLCLGLLAPYAALAEEEVKAETFKPEQSVMTEFPERTTGLDSYELFQNTSAELLSDGGKKIYGWSWTSHIGRDNTYLGCGFVDISSDAHSEAQSVHLNCEEKQYISLGPDTVEIKEGETYEFTIWYKRLKEGGKLRLQGTISGKNKGVAQNYGRLSAALNDSTANDGWVRGGLTFVAPPYAQKLSVGIRLDGPGEVLIDDVSLRCITDVMPTPEMPEKKPAIKKVEIEDASFENGTVGQLIDTIPGWDSVVGTPRISDKYAHTGTKSCDLYVVDGGKDAIGIRYLTGLEEGATYQVSSWLMNPTQLKIDVGYWMHWCTEETYTTDPTKQLGQEKPRWKVEPNMNFVEYRAEFTVPQGTKSAMLYFRHRIAPGSIFMDDVEIYMVKPPAAAKIETDEIFYYTEWKTGVVTINPTYLMGDPKGARAEFVMTNESGKKVYEGSFSDLSGPREFEFPTSVMTVKGERHNINVKVYGADGTLQQEENLPVFRYDRPTYLGADGIFRKNGKEIHFSMANGLNMNRIERHPEKSGITVAQLIADNPKLGFELEERMDAYYAQGMFVVLNIYSGKITAGHPDYIDSAKIYVNQLKDHPALLGYKLMDEPYQKGISDEEMILAYKTIRDIDPHHPIYIDDSPTGGYEWMFKFCDIFETDYYAGSPYKMTEIVEMVQAASKGRKPFGVLLQFFQQNGYFPEADHLRSMTYQSFFAGGYTNSYHTFGVDGTDGNKIESIDRPQWKELAENWAPWELDFAVGCFVKNQYKFVNYQKTEAYIWGTFTDGTDLYAITLNRSKDISCHVDVPLADGTGILKIGDYSAVAMTGDTTRTVSGNGTLSVDLAPWEASVWKVTPSAPFAADHLKTTSFNDIIDYPWAYNAITTLEEKGIVNRVSDVWYGPGQNITRGDYAMFLVRTLGLTDGEGENFADVDPNAEYAKELAIGKAAGIINGVGDNKFNPTAQITRQDMMTMTSRALSLAGSADLGSFSDAGLIADYAQTHVSAMVAEGLIRGNADGTINPLGNTTRAEAAVIMQRILAK